MERRDYLLDELNRLGRVLAALLARLTAQPVAGTSLVETSVQSLQTELDWDLEASLDLPEEAFVPHLIGDKGLDEQQLGMLAQLLEAMGDSLEPTQLEWQRRYYGRALHIYAYLERHARLYAFDRPARMARLLAALQLD